LPILTVASPHVSQLGGELSSEITRDIINYRWRSWMKLLPILDVDCIEIMGMEPVKLRGRLLTGGASQHQCSNDANPSL
jgi:hypothetical protein